MYTVHCTVYSVKQRKWKEAPAVPNWVGNTVTYYIYIVNVCYETVGCRQAFRKRYGSMYRTGTMNRN